MLIKKGNIKKILLGLIIPGWVFFFMPCAQAEISKIENISTIANTQSILIKWAKPILQETEGIVVIRKKEVCPKDVFDGEMIYRGNGNSLIDEHLDKNIAYCYGVYVYDSSGTTSPIKSSELVKIRTAVEYLQIILEDNISIGIGIILIVILAGLNVWKRKKNLF